VCVGSGPLRYRNTVVRKRTDVEGSARERGETTEEVLDRNVNELLQEMRVAITGVQVLFAFLLTLPFQQRFSTLTDFGIAVYALAIGSSAAATTVFIAPVSAHRLLFRQHEKERLVRFADRALMTGLALLLIGIASSLLLVLDVVLGRWPAIAGCAVITLTGLTTWYAAPLAERRGRG